MAFFKEEETVPFWIDKLTISVRNGNISGRHCFNKLVRIGSISQLAEEEADDF